MKTILFSPITFNLATTGKAVAIAKTLSKDFNCHFSSYGGSFEHLIEQAGFPLTRLEPRLTSQKIKRLYAIDQGRWIGPSHSAAYVRQLVRSELDLYQKIQPAAVVTGMNPSACISAPVAHIPLVWVIQSGVAMNTGARLGKLKDMDLLSAAPLRWLPDAARVRLSQWLLDAVFFASAATYNKVAVEYGLKPFRSLEDLFTQGYHLLIGEPPGFSDLPHLPNSHYIGPLITRLDGPLPDEVLNIPHDMPIIYFAMGSSGRADVVYKILAAFAGRPYRVIAPVKNLLDKRPMKIPKNVTVTGWIPALQASQIADLSVIHGGIGTVMNACLGGKPVVGVAMSPEQFLNLESLAQKGFALHIPLGRLTPERLFTAIEQLLADPQACEKARAYQKVAQAWDDPKYVHAFFLENFA
jgi:UDP:flavonoid glycosyltransferase YjiC (YdhE family)